MKKILLFLIAILLITCQKTERPQPLTLSIVEVHHNLCFGYDYAYAIVQAHGGVPPYQYRIDTNRRWQSTGIFKHLPSGGHTIRAKGQWGDSAKVLFVIVGLSTPCNSLPTDK